MDKERARFWSLSRPHVNHWRRLWDFYHPQQWEPHRIPRHLSLLCLQPVRNSYVRGNWIHHSQWVKYKCTILWSYHLDLEAKVCRNGCSCSLWWYPLYLPSTSPLTSALCVCCISVYMWTLGMEWVKNRPTALLIILPCTFLIML